MVSLIRVLAAAGATGLAAVLSAAAASPGTASAATGERGRDAQVRYAINAALAPRPGEWWFSWWHVQHRVWPLSEAAGVTVAVLDTGVQAGVPDLRGVVLPGGDATGHGTDGRSDFNSIGDGHGTMMSVLIAGQGSGTGMAGIAPRAKILPIVVNAAAADVTVSPGAVATGIVYAASHGARVINISQAHRTASASGCDPVEQAAVAYALARDIVVVAAAGNIGLTGGGPADPASCAGVLAVGAVGPGGALWRGSTRQPYVSVAAPGADLVTSGRDGRLLTNVNGTRSASALVSGAVALIRSRYPAMPWYRVIQRLTGTALPAGGHAPNDSFGYGIVRLDRAVNATAFPVPSTAPNPVLSKYQAWLATAQGRSIPRRMGGSAPSAAVPQPPAKGASPQAQRGAGAPLIIIVSALLALALAGVALVARRERAGKPPTERSGKPGRHGARGRQPGPAFPDVTRGPEPSPPYRDPAYDDFPAGSPASFPGRPHRVPPYTPAPRPGSSRPPWDGAAPDGLLRPITPGAACPARGSRPAAGRRSAVPDRGPGPARRRSRRAAASAAGARPSRPCARPVRRAAPGPRPAP
jgi:hypothetical protein